MHFTRYFRDVCETWERRYMGRDSFQRFLKFFRKRLAFASSLLVRRRLRQVFFMDSAPHWRSLGQLQTNDLTSSPQICCCTALCWNMPASKAFTFSTLGDQHLTAEPIASKRNGEPGRNNFIGTIG